ncbi:MAG TPA: hypothetical protein VFZ43_09330 [Anaerolineales bacterium]
MSGHKRATVTISEDEYRRLHQADMKRRFRGHTSVKANNAGQTVMLTNMLQQIENRQQQLEQALSNLNHSFDLMEAETVQEILMQNALCYESLREIIEETTSDTNDSLALISQRFTEEIQREREQHGHNLHCLVQRFNTYEQNEQVKAEAAHHWLKQSVVLADFIQEQFDHERFLPGKLSRVLGSLDFAQNNLIQGFLEASMQTSQQALLQLSELHFELEQRSLEWQTEYERARSALSQFVAELELNASVNAFGLQGEELPEQVDLAYWSNGKYHQLLDKCKHLLALLSQDHQSISTEELTRTHTELLPVITASFESIIYEARLNALNSQLRMNIAETALQALEVHGFTLSESGYVNQDMRAPFMAHLGNDDGSQVTIQVLPTDKVSQELANELVVITQHPYLKTEEAARMQWQELCRSLNQYDLSVSRPEVRASPPLAIPDHVEGPALLNRQLIRSERQNDVR